MVGRKVGKMGKYSLDSIFKSEYEGHPWKLEDLFLANGKNNAAYLRAIEEVYESQERIEGINYDKPFQDAFMKFAGIKISVLTKAEIQELKDNLEQNKEIFEDFRGIETVSDCIANINKNFTPEGDIRNIKITQKQKDQILNLINEIEIEKVKFEKKIKEIENEKFKIENNTHLSTSSRNKRVERIEVEINGLMLRMESLTNVHDKIEKLDQIIQAIKKVDSAMNAANKELTNLNFITGTDTMRPLLKKYHINYDVLSKAWPKVPVRLELSWDSKDKLGYTMVPQTYVYSEGLGLQKITVEDFKGLRVNKQAKNKLQKEIKASLLKPINYEESKFIFPSGWENNKSARDFFSELISNYNKNIGLLAKDNKKEPIGNTHRFEASLELVSGMLALAYYPTAEEQHKDYLNARDRLTKKFKDLPDAKDKKQAKRLELSEKLWEQREKPHRENVERETASINWVEAFNTLVSITSYSDQKVEDIDYAIEWIKRVFIGKLLTCSRFTDTFKSKLPSGLQGLDLSPLHTLVEEKNRLDVPKCSSSELTGRSARTENSEGLSYDPETVFMALWFIITRDDYNLSEW